MFLRYIFNHSIGHTETILSLHFSFARLPCNILRWDDVDIIISYVLTNIEILLNSSTSLHNEINGVDPKLI